MPFSHSTASKLRDLINKGSFLPILCSFEELNDLIGFERYYENAAKYKNSQRDGHH
jgi:hypothetical protein